MEVMRGEARECRRDADGFKHSGGAGLPWPAGQELAGTKARNNDMTS